jgi:UDP-glucose 4-epimerase
MAENRGYGPFLVTDRTGYIGSHAVRQLSEAGHRIGVFVNHSKGFADALINEEEPIVVNLAAPSAIEAAFEWHRFKTVRSWNREHLAGSN